jgi:hypothetical protein
VSSGKQGQDKTCHSFLCGKPLHGDGPVPSRSEPEGSLDGVVRCARLKEEGMAARRFPLTLVRGIYYLASIRTLF